MLTFDLVRARRRGDEVRPQYLDAGSATELARAEELVALFSAHLGRTRGELDDALAERVGEATDYLLHRGLAKLLFDRCAFEVEAPRPPSELRRAVFEAAAAVHPVAQREGDVLHPVTRAEVLARAAAALGLEPAVLERALYGDLEDQQRLTAFDPLAPRALLERYNLALAQAVLLRASSVTVTIAPGDPKRYRQLFRFIKFYGLIHTVRGDRKRGYEITLDGPLSLFQQSTRYGLKLAEFLPALLLCEGWSLEAQLQWGKERRAAKLRLTPDHGLASHYPDKGVYVTAEERAFLAKVKALETPWKAVQRAELIDLGGRGVLVPDVVLRHADGREALLEIVGFWRKGALEGRAALLREFGPANLILAVSRKLGAAREKLEALPGASCTFADVLPAREILALAEQVALKPARG